MVNCIPEMIQVTEGHMLASPDSRYRQAHSAFIFSSLLS